VNILAITGSLRSALKNTQLLRALAADHVIDLGPEGGDGGGEVVAVGTPEEIAANPRSITGRYLKGVMPSEVEASPADARSA
jgi:hypothetical protein